MVLLVNGLEADLVDFFSLACNIYMVYNFSEMVFFYFLYMDFSKQCDFPVHSPNVSFLVSYHSKNRSPFIVYCLSCRTLEKAVDC